MSKDTMGGPQAWTTAMQEAQATMARQWADANAAWMKMMGGSLSGAGSAGPLAGLGFGPGAALGGIAMPGADMGKHLLGQFENYLGVTRSLWELLGRSASASDPAQRQHLFNAGLAALQTQFASLFTPPAGTMPTGMMNPFAANAGGLNSTDWLQWPALGPAREQQESWQKLTALVGRCAQAQGKLALLWKDIISAGLKELGGRLGPKLQSGGIPGSMKELYDNWVESAESAYKNAANGAAFMQAQAELSNATNELRVAQREMMEEWGKQFDLPTRAELNSLHQQVKQLSAAVRKLGG